MHLQWAKSKKYKWKLGICWEYMELYEKKDFMNEIEIVIIKYKNILNTS